MPGKTRVMGAVAASLAFVSMLGEVLAAEPGYWRCSGTDWVAVGTPQTPAPAKACGVERAMPDNRADCERAGGTWGPAGIFPQPICRLPTADGGRPCADDGECEGRCLAALTPGQRDQVQGGARLQLLGACTPVTPVFGCMAIVEKGFVGKILCAD